MKTIIYIGIAVLMSAVGCKASKKSEPDNAPQAGLQQSEFLVKLNGQPYYYSKPDSQSVFEGTNLTNSESNKTRNARLIDGSIVYDHEFFAIGLSRQKYAGCTSTIIGPNTLLTAAHCVDDGGEPAVVSGLTMRIRNEIKTQYKFDCSINDSYRNANDRKSFQTVDEQVRGDATGPRNSYDVALCILTSHEQISIGDIEPFFEVLDFDYVPKIDDPILMTGRGCTVSDKEGIYVRMDQVDGLLRVGRAFISGVPLHEKEIRNEEIDGKIVQSIVPRASRVGSIESEAEMGGRESSLCPVDSGGPLFTNASPVDYNKKRRVIAVNSAVGLVDTEGKSLRSYFARINTPVVKDHFDAFVKDYPAAKICGYNLVAGTGGCRD